MCTCKLTDRYGAPDALQAARGFHVDCRCFPPILGSHAHTIEPRRSSTYNFRVGAQEKSLACGIAVVPFRHRYDVHCLFMKALYIKQRHLLCATRDILHHYKGLIERRAGGVASFPAPPRRPVGQGHNHVGFSLWKGVYLRVIPSYNGRSRLVLISPLILRLGEDWPARWAGRRHLRGLQRDDRIEMEFRVSMGAIEHQCLLSRGLCPTGERPIIMPLASIKAHMAPVRRTCLGQINI